MAKANAVQIKQEKAAEGDMEPMQIDADVHGIGQRDRGEVPVAAADIQLRVRQFDVLVEPCLDCPQD